LKLDTDLFSAADLFGNAYSEPEPAATTAVATGGRSIVFDAETGPEPEDRLREFFEVDLSKVKDRELIDREFDPASVKLGNLKDQAKIDAKIAAKREEFEAAKAAAVTAMASAETDQWAAFVERAPLSPITGRVLAIGLWDSTNELEPTLVWIDGKQGGEMAVLNAFWMAFRDCVATDTRLVGHNIFGFDLPFLVRRSWLLGVRVPDEVIVAGRPHRLFVDTMRVWACSNYQDRISLDRLAAFLGSTRKNGDGADFHRLFFGTEEERQQALDYLKNDLRMTSEVAERMGVL